jgi:transcriptional regulator with XRE-family HTH domain
MTTSKIITKIRYFRESKGYSQSYIASELNISTKTYSRIENQKSVLHFETFIIILKILQIPICEFLESILDANDIYNESYHNQLKQNLNQINLLKSQIIFMKSLLDRQSLQTKSHPSRDGF